MKMWRVLLVLLPFVLAVLLPSVQAVSIEVRDWDNKPLEGVKVKVYKGNEIVAEGETNASGVVDFANITEGIYTVLVIVNESHYIIGVINASTGYVVINASDMPHLTFYSTPLKVDFNITVTETNTTLGFTTNTTVVYVKSAVNITFPLVVKKFPYKYTFKKIVYDGTETTDPYLYLEVPSTMNVTAYYERGWWITITTTQAIVILLAVVTLILILLAVMRAGAKVIAERTRKYWTTTTKKYWR